MMGRAVIGGIITLLTLVVVPVIYTYLDDFAERTLMRTIVWVICRPSFPAFVCAVHTVVSAGRRNRSANRSADRYDA